MKISHYISSSCLSETNGRKRFCAFLRLTPHALLLTLFFAPSLFAWQPGGVPVCTDTAGQGSPCIAKTTDGFVVGWTDARPGSFYDIYAQKLDAEGRSLWTLNGVVVCNQESLQNNPLVASGTNGSAFFVWDDYRLYVDNPRFPFIFGQHLSTAGSKLWSPAGLQVGLGMAGAVYPEMISDSAGGFFLVYLDIGQMPYDYVLPVATRLDSAGTRLWSKGLYQGGILQCRSPHLISDGQGGIVVVWPNIFGYPFGQRLSSQGQELWRRGGLCLDSANVSNLGNNALAPDATHGVIYTWVIHRGNYDLFAQRVSGDSIIQWPRYGVPISISVGNPKAVPDGAGGAIIVWERGASGVRDIFGQRVDSTGSWLWDTLEVPVIRATGDQTGIQVVSDEAGGVIVTWQDNRNGNKDILAQRLNPSGQRLWDTLGVQIGVWSGEQTAPVMCQDGAGGAVIAWLDTRNGNYDIYTQRVSASGSGVWEEACPSRLTPHASRLTVSPNPFTSFASIPGHASERFALYDIFGRKVGVFKGDRIGEGLPAGVYFLRPSDVDAKPIRIVKLR